MSPARWGCWRHRRNGLAAKSWAARLAGSSPPPPPFRQGRGSEQSCLRSTQNVFPTTVFSASPPGLSPPPISLAELCLFRRVTAWGVSERRSASEAWAPWEVTAARLPGRWLVCPPSSAKARAGPAGHSGRRRGRTVPFNQLGHPVAGAATRFIDKEKRVWSEWGNLLRRGWGGWKVLREGPPAGTPTPHSGDARSPRW